MAIIHPWFPKYRLGLFREIKSESARRGIDVDIYYGAVPPEWESRGDVASHDVAKELPTRYLHLGRKTVSYKSLLPVMRGYDVIVAEQAVRNLETYRLLWRNRPILAFWGHGRTYTQESSGIQEKLKQWLTRRGRWFFAYTRGGEAAVLEAGFEAGRTTVVMNATDTRELRVGVEGLSSHSARELLDAPGKDRVLIYIGGLDSSKRIEFMLESVDKAFERGARFQLLIAGDGDMRDEVAEFAATRPHVSYVGRVELERKAALFKLASAVLMPGRIGLVAVDAIACGVPVLSAEWPFHAPEREYLIEGSSVYFSRDNPDAYARAIADFCADPASMFTPSTEAEAIRDELSVENAGRNFAAGLYALGVSEGIINVAT